MQSKFRDKGVEHRNKRVRDGIEIFGADRRQNHEMDAFVSSAGIPNIVRPAVDGDVVAARRKPYREFFGKCLKSAVVGGNAARAKDGQFHRTGL